MKPWPGNHPIVVVQDKWLWRLPVDGNLWKLKNTSSGLVVVGLTELPHQTILKGRLPLTIHPANLGFIIKLLQTKENMSNYLMICTVQKKFVEQCFAI